MNSLEAPPKWRGQDRVLLRGGSVYSADDPFATAMLVVGHEVAWIGGDGAALALSDGVDAVIDLDGALVTPAFVDAHAVIVDVARDRAVAAQRGIGLLQVMNGSAGQDAGPLTITSESCLSITEAQNDIAEAVISLIRAGERPILHLTAADHLPAALGSLKIAAATLEAAGMAAVRVDVTQMDPAAASSMASLGAGVCALWSPAHGFAGVALASLASHGVPLSFGTAPHAQPSPWSLIGDAVNHRDPTQRISARAAFAAATKGGWRAVGLNGMGTLVPGAPAHYAIWDAGQLVVQAPDERVQAWSTDPRSGTPGLPDVSPGAAPPLCLRTVIWGRTVFAK